MKNILRNILSVFLLICGLLLYATLFFTISFGIIFTVGHLFSDKPNFIWSTLGGNLFSIIFISITYYQQVREKNTNDDFSGKIKWHISYSFYILIAVVVFRMSTLTAIDEYLESRPARRVIVPSNTIMKAFTFVKSGDTIEFEDKAAFKKEINAIMNNKNLHWERTVSEDGNFSIMFPHFPNYKVKQHKKKEIIDGQRVWVHHLELKTSEKTDPNLAYFISFYAIDTTKEPLEGHFENQKQGILSKIDGVLANEFSIDTLGFPCKEFSVITHEGYTKATTRMIYNNGFLYKVTVLTQKGNFLNEGIHHFLNSFTIMQDN